MRRVLTALLAFTLFALAMLASADATMRVTVEGKGTFTILLYTDKAPKTTAQIMRLAKSGFYDGQRFHIAIRSPRPYRVQVGDPASKNNDLSGLGGSGTTVPFEDTGLPNIAGAVGLSHVPDDKASGDSQFYVLLGSARFLDGNYTVFGKITEGMDVVEKVEKGDKIEKVTVTEK
jgi:cyclophilin family peptidyl-prolyl cis-trans isomerase